MSFFFFFLLRKELHWNHQVKFDSLDVAYIL
jgi:hypothetical protein